MDELLNKKKRKYLQPWLVVLEIFYCVTQSQSRQEYEKSNFLANKANKPTNQCQR